jgi:AmmeMemoRadiSam system protein A
VTLKKEGVLRGCIGSLEAEKPLFLDVAINANLAAFSDPRFLPLSFSELPKISLEISVLTPSRPLVYKNKEELLKKLHPSLGVILEKDGRRATFLPQVWEELPEKTLFLEELALKAGLHKDDWQRASFSVYEVEKFASKQGFLILQP